MEHAITGATTDRSRFVASATKRVALYWFATGYLVFTSALGGVAAILREPPVFNEILRLGYPPHFATLLGIWKVLGATALAVPGRPLLKEWAYAGFFVDITGAIAAYLAIGDGLASFIGPMAAMAALTLSWTLRPSSRRLDSAGPAFRS
jgi:hypothetical protein